MWSFQDETRFVLIAVPKKSVKEITGKNIDNCMLVLLQKPKTGLNYIDVEIDLKMFNNLDLILGPLSDKSHKIIVASLLNKYLPDFNIRIKKSKIKIRKKR